MEQIPFEFGVALWIIALLCVLIAFGLVNNGCTDRWLMLFLILLIVAGWLVWHGINIVSYGSWQFPLEPPTPVSCVFVRGGLTCADAW